MDPHDPAWHAESWFLDAARRAKQLNVRRVSVIEGRLKRDESCTSPFGEFGNAASPHRNTFGSLDDQSLTGNSPLATTSDSLVDAFLEGRLDPGGFECTTATSLRDAKPREAGLYAAARSEDKLGVVPSAAPKSWNEQWPKTRVPGRRVVAVFHDDQAASEFPKVQVSEDEPSREHAAATARAFRGTEDRGEVSPIEKVFSNASLKKNAPFAFAAKNCSDRTAFLSETASPHVMSRFETKGETAEEAFVRFRNDPNANHKETAPEEMRFARELAIAKTKVQIEKVKRATKARAQEK
jgi:hypothetical protein|tara:strand:+ start:126 stop:1013 length:888 start_codon:yes stop_codon:yes gene_type:complete